jgi:hypothetical protein
MTLQKVRDEDSDGAGQVAVKGAGSSEGVAQIFNLLYRRLAVCWSSV